MNVLYQCMCVCNAGYPTLFATLIVNRNNIYHAYFC